MNDPVKQLLWVYACMISTELGIIVAQIPDRVFCPGQHIYEKGLAEREDDGLLESIFKRYKDVLFFATKPCANPRGETLYFFDRKHFLAEMCKTAEENKEFRECMEPHITKTLEAIKREPWTL